MAKVIFLLGLLRLEFEIHAVDADVSVLLFFHGVDRLEVFYNNMNNLLIHPRSNEAAAMDTLFFV